MSHTFTRASTLFRDKGGNVQKKESMLELTNISLDTQEIVGQAEIDLGAYFGKTNEDIKVDMTQLKIA